MLQLCRHSWPLPLLHIPLVHMAMWQYCAHTVSYLSGILTTSGCMSDQIVCCFRVRRPQGKELSTSEQAPSSGQEQQHYTHILCISPDAPTNPVLYWLGIFDPVETRFILDGAQGPLKLDLGDTLYAPNLLEDEEVCTESGCLGSVCAAFAFSLDTSGALHASFPALVDHVVLVTC